ncbi:SDR family oxidoreductase [Oceanobacillus sp. CFH 90083]|uniref:SDR family oxidoreductase n=1 Tax=Oceanobacillus sp. CFH 90083 TaxID=2592336 RepID=UPI00128BA6F5|nr:SDR family oxidoreductase [Oceanobacillus sp. CFH 90083]
MNKFDTLEGKVVVIAEGGNSLGALLSKDYARAGAEVIIHYHNEAFKQEAELTRKEIVSKGGQAVLFQGDLTNAGTAKELFEFAIKVYGKVDIAINTIGKEINDSIAKTSKQKGYFTLIDNHVTSTYFFKKEAEQHMNHNGKIIEL